jgi:hypothetical protein
MPPRHAGVSQLPRHEMGHITPDSTAALATSLPQPGGWITTKPGLTAASLVTTEMVAAQLGHSRNAFGKTWASAA